LSVDDPAVTMAGLLAAERLGAVPVLAASGWSGPGLRRILDRAAGLVAGLVAGHAAGPHRLVVVTSGSSGSPRAVVRTAQSWLASFAGFDRLLDAACPPGGTVWVPGGADSTLTLFGLWHALATGRPALASGRWRGPGAAARVGAEAVAVHCVPAVLAGVLDARRSGALPRLRRAVVAGAALPDAVRAAATELGVTLAEYYGAAELSFVAADPDGTGLRPFPGAELAVRSGVIWARSPYLADGYLADRDLTTTTSGQEPAGPFRRDPQGWATVGDRGELVDGRLRVHGRGDQAASVGGHVVLLDDVQRALADVAGMVELVCLAEPDARLGERVLCVLHLAEASQHAALVAALRAAARDRLPAPARPVRYVLAEGWPRTPGGKVARAALRDRLRR
jgi:acyl-CoA synthetase (AMP-forming)/AMP-acid ligase II